MININDDNDKSTLWLLEDDLLSHNIQDDDSYDIDSIIDGPTTSSTISSIVNNNNSHDDDYQLLIKTDIESTGTNDNDNGIPCRSDLIIGPKTSRTISSIANNNNSHDDDQFLIKMDDVTSPASTNGNDNIPCRSDSFFCPTTTSTISSIANIKNDHDDDYQLIKTDDVTSPGTNDNDNILCHSLYCFKDSSSMHVCGCCYNRYWYDTPYIICRFILTSITQILSYLWIIISTTSLLCKPLLLSSDNHSKRSYILFFILFGMTLLCCCVSFITFDIVNDIYHIYIPQYQLYSKESISTNTLIHMEQQELNSVTDHYNNLYNQMTYDHNILLSYENEKYVDKHYYHIYNNDSINDHMKLAEYENYRIKSMKHHMDHIQHQMNTSYNDINNDLHNIIIIEEENNNNNNNNNTMSTTSDYEQQESKLLESLSTTKQLASEELVVVPQKIDENDQQQLQQDLLLNPKKDDNDKETTTPSLFHRIVSFFWRQNDTNQQTERKLERRRRIMDVNHSNNNNRYDMNETYDDNKTHFTLLLIHDIEHYIQLQNDYEKDQLKLNDTDNDEIMKYFQDKYQNDSNMSMKYHELYENDMKHIHDYHIQYQQILHDINQTKVYMNNIEQSINDNQFKHTNYTLSALSIQYIIIEQTNDGMLSLTIILLCYLLGMIFYIYTLVKYVIMPWWQHQHKKMMTISHHGISYYEVDDNCNQSLLSVSSLLHFWKIYRHYISMMIQHVIIFIISIQYTNMTSEHINQDYNKHIKYALYSLTYFSFISSIIQIILYRIISPLLVLWYVSTSTSSSSDGNVTSSTSSSNSRNSDHHDNKNNRGIIQNVLISLWSSMSLALFHWILLFWIFLYEFVFLYFINVIDSVLYLYNKHSIIILLIFICLYIQYIFQQLDNIVDQSTSFIEQYQYHHHGDNDDSPYKFLTKDSHDNNSTVFVQNGNISNHNMIHHHYNSCNNNDIECNMGVDNVNDDDDDNHDDEYVDVEQHMMMNTTSTTQAVAATTIDIGDSPKSNDKTISTIIESPSSSSSTCSWPSTNSILLIDETQLTCSDTTPLLLSSSNSNTSISNNNHADDDDDNHSNTNNNHDQSQPIINACWDVLSYKSSNSTEIFPDDYLRTTTTAATTTIMEDNRSVNDTNASEQHMRSCIDTIYYYIKSSIDTLLFLCHYEKITKRMIQYMILLFFMVIVLLSIHSMIYLSHIKKMMMMKVT